MFSKRVQDANRLVQNLLDSEDSININRIIAGLAYTKDVECAIT